MTKYSTTIATSADTLLLVRTRHTLTRGYICQSPERISCLKGQKLAPCIKAQGVYGGTF